MSEDNKEQKSSGQWHGGKGSVQKPNDQDKFADGWDKIWGKKDKVQKHIDSLPERREDKPGSQIGRKTLSKRERVLMHPKHFDSNEKKDK